MIVQSAEIYSALELPGTVRIWSPAVVIHHSVEYVRPQIPITGQPVYKEPEILPEPIRIPV